MLIRYRLIATRWGGLYVHHFLRSDQDRDLHDHPWHFTSLILWAGYYEEVPYAACITPWIAGDRHKTMLVRRRPGTIVRHLADDAHRVLLANGRPAWTLLWVSPKVREWGFYTKDGWVPWQEYGA
jgi:hypothetical protein